MNEDPTARLILCRETNFCKARKDSFGDYTPPDIDQCLDPYNIDWEVDEFVCWQPEELDNYYLNLILFCPKRNIMFRSNSIDWDFNHVPQEIIDEAAQYEPQPQIKEPYATITTSKP